MMTTDQTLQTQCCVRLLRQGHTADFLRGAGYAEGAIQAALKEVGE